MRRQEGLALVIVIWVLSLLTIMAGSFALTMRRETRVISAVKNGAEALAAAESGLMVAQQMLLLSDPYRRWRIDGSLYELIVRDAEVRVRIMSEQGKVDINKADEALLTKLMQSASLELDREQALVSAIMDWRDNDDLVRLNGAEKEEYADAGRAYQPFNHAFRYIEELQLVLGMDAEVYQKLQPLVTVYSGAGQVNLQLASSEVLSVVSDMDEQQLDELMLQRSMADLGLSQEQNSLTNANIQGVEDNGVYTVVSQARVNGDHIAGIKVVIRKSNRTNRAQPFEILEWRHTDQTTSLFSEDMEQLLMTQQHESGQQY